jgi:hypothetical protein
MVAQDKITSGFDVEFLMGEEYIKYFLLSSMETGSIPWFSETEVKDAQGNHVRTDATATHPPEELNQKSFIQSIRNFWDTRIRFSI